LAVQEPQVVVVWPQQLTTLHGFAVPSPQL
jgi:hypothetical protein